MRVLCYLALLGLPIVFASPTRTRRDDDDDDDDDENFAVNYRRKYGDVSSPAYNSQLEYHQVERADLLASSAQSNQRKKNKGRKQKRKKGKSTNNAQILQNLNSPPKLYYDDSEERGNNQNYQSGQYQRLQELNPNGDSSEEHTGQRLVGSYNTGIGTGNRLTVENSGEKQGAGMSPANMGGAQSVTTGGTGGDSSGKDTTMASGNIGDPQRVGTVERDNSEEITDMTAKIIGDAQPVVAGIPEEDSSGEETMMTAANIRDPKPVVVGTTGGDSSEEETKMTAANTRDQQPVVVGTTEGDSSEEETKMTAANTRDSQPVVVGATGGDSSGEETKVTAANTRDPQPVVVGTTGGDSSAEETDITAVNIGKPRPVVTGTGGRDTSEEEKTKIAAGNVGDAQQFVAGITTGDNSEEETEVPKVNNIGDTQPDVKGGSADKDNKESYPNQVKPLVTRPSTTTVGPLSTSASTAEVITEKLSTFPEKINQPDESSQVTPTPATGPIVTTCECYGNINRLTLICDFFSNETEANTALQAESTNPNIAFCCEEETLPPIGRLRCLQQRNEEFPEIKESQTMVTQDASGIPNSTPFTCTCVGQLIAGNTFFKCDFQSQGTDSTAYSAVSESATVIDCCTVGKYNFNQALECLKDESTDDSANYESETEELPTNSPYACGCSYEYKSNDIFYKCSFKGEYKFGVNDFLEFEVISRDAKIQRCCSLDKNFKESVECLRWVRNQTEFEDATISPIDGGNSATQFSRNFIDQYTCDCNPKQLGGENYYECVFFSDFGTAKYNFTKTSSSSDIVFCCSTIEYTEQGVNDRVKCLREKEDFIPSEQLGGNIDPARIILTESGGHASSLDDSTIHEQVGGQAVEANVVSVTKSVPVSGTGDASGTGGASATGGVSETSGASSTGGPSGSIGVSGSGGASTTGGVSGTSGLSGTGGASATGAVLETSGASATSGVSGTGGASVTGGVSGTGTGGGSATGGVSRTGGASATGGVSGASGVSGTGGASATGGVSRTGSASATGVVSGTGGTIGVLQPDATYSQSRCQCTSKNSIFVCELFRYVDGQEDTSFFNSTSYDIFKCCQQQTVSHEEKLQCFQSFQSYTGAAETSGTIDGMRTASGTSSAGAGVGFQTSYRCSCEFKNNQYYECVFSTTSSTTGQNYTKKSSSSGINQCCGEQYVLSSIEDRISCFSSFDSWVPSGDVIGHGAVITTDVTSGLGGSHGAGSSTDVSGVGIGLGADSRLNILTKPQTSAAGTGLDGTFQTTTCTCQADITDQQTTYSCVYKTGDGIEESPFLSISTDNRINQCCTEARDNVLVCMMLYDGIGINSGGSSASVSGAGASRKGSAGAGVFGTSVSGSSASASGVSGSGVYGATAGISKASGTVDSQVNKYAFGNGFDLQRNGSIFSSEHSEAHQCNCRSLLVNTERVYKCNITYTLDDQVETIDANSSSAEIFKCCDAVLPIDARVSCFRLFENMNTNTFSVTDKTERMHGYLSDHAGVSEAAVTTGVTILVPSEKAVKEWLQQSPDRNINKTTDGQVIKGERYSAKEFTKNKTVSLPELYNTIQLMEQTCAVIVKSIETNEGVLHILSKVLDPPHSTVYDVVINDDRFSTLASFIKRFDSIREIIHGEDFTLLAPTDDAFANVENLDSLMEEDIKEIILYHIIEKRQCCHELIPRAMPSRRMTAVGKTVMVQRIRHGYGTVNRSRVTECDITAENGVIHTINAVLKP